ncbi:MAG: carboxypeptidase-like regulatory domain-containing protein, partial [Phycisphaerae bacterium]
MKSLLTLALLLASPFLRGAEPQALPSPADAPEKFAIGTVVDTGGAPVAGAEVHDTTTSESASTDREGKFVLRWADAKSPCHGMIFAEKGTGELGWISGYGLGTVGD